jgi:hypothetical protein
MDSGTPAASRASSNLLATVVRWPAADFPGNTQAPLAPCCLARSLSRMRSLMGTNLRDSGAFPYGMKTCERSQCISSQRLRITSSGRIPQSSMMANTSATSCSIFSRSACSIQGSMRTFLPYAFDRLMRGAARRTPSSVAQFRIRASFFARCGPTTVHPERKGPRHLRRISDRSECRRCR